MLRDIPITEARRKITSLPEELAQDTGAVAITRRGRPVLAIMPWDLYESIAETLEIMADEEIMAALKKGLQDIKKGRLYSLQEVKKELGL
jgi:prevent-host-death family protein